MALGAKLLSGWSATRFSHGSSSFGSLTKLAYPTHAGGASVRSTIISSPIPRCSSAQSIRSPPSSESVAKSLVTSPIRSATSLVLAAWELADGIDNVRHRNFLYFTSAGNSREVEARSSTLFRLAQYFAWREILRREIQLLRFEKEADSRGPR